MNPGRRRAHPSFDGTIGRYAPFRDTRRPMPKVQVIFFGA